jgi:hypothetical protein
MPALSSSKRVSRTYRCKRSYSSSSFKRPMSSKRNNLVYSSVVCACRFLGMSIFRSLNSVQIASIPIAHPFYVLFCLVLCFFIFVLGPPYAGKKSFWDCKKRAQNQICPNKKEKNPPYARLFPTERALFLILGVKKCQKKETFDTKKTLDVKGQKNVFF